MLQSCSKTWNAEASRDVCGRVLVICFLSDHTLGRKISENSLYILVSIDPTSMKVVRYEFTQQDTVRIGRSGKFYSAP